jgi:threonylcarbamoyladenosine tRNA methylthiotransferase MtaB
MPEPVPCSVDGMTPTVFIKTLGCRLNQAESSRIAASFRAAGVIPVSRDEDADIGVIHTCTITHEAERSCAQAARRLRRRGVRIVVLAGCAVEHDGERLKAATGADVAVGQDDKFRIPELLAEHELLVGMSPPDVGESPLVPTFSSTRALVKVQDGCDFRCAYCIVPSTRGAPVSRSSAEILEEVRALARVGHREFVLTGANLGCYRDGKIGLIELLKAIESEPDVARVRIGSIEMTTSEQALIDHMQTSTKLCRFLHVPLQSGDDRILKAMGRRYDAATYRQCLETAAAAIPGVGLGTDIIVGFPGEDDRAFANTLSLVEELPLSNLHVFAYSKRQGTRAAAMDDQVDERVKKERSLQLIACGKRKREAFARSWIGRSVDVLIERIDDGVARGWTDHYLDVRIHDASLRVNDLATVVPDACEGDVLYVGTGR